MKRLNDKALARAIALRSEIYSVSVDRAAKALYAVDTEGEDDAQALDDALAVVETARDELSAIFDELQWLATQIDAEESQESSTP